MKYRALGSTGIVVSEIGFGTWGIGGWTPGQRSYGPTDDATSLAALHRAFELGVTFVDTAHLYGLGHSEQLVGKAIRGRRDKVVLATKAGYVDYASPSDYSPDAIVRSLETSLDRLGTDYIDLLQLHGPSVDGLRAHPEIVECLVRLRERCLVRAIGLSAETPTDAVAALRLFAFAAVQVNLNMLDLRALECGLFERARAAGVGIIARTPLCFGFLSGAIAPDTVFPPHDHRSRWNGRQVASWVEGARTLLAAGGAGRGQTPVQAALRFCLSFPEVSVVIPGIVTPDEAGENAAASDLGPLPPDVIDAVLEYHARHDTAPERRSTAAQTRARPE